MSKIGSIMQLLFLDTETNGVNPQVDSIIEIAGIIAELNETTLQLVVIDTFSELVYLEENFDERTTRLTGITHEELLSAQKKPIIQQEWQEWLEKYTPVAVIGHSIEFDLAFLRSENWFLPPTLTVIDTLNLAKIVFPHAKAVNLEYIFHANKLSQLQHKLFPVQNTTNVHRALFDTELCTTLFQYSIEQLSTKSLLPGPFFDTFISTFLGIPIILYNPYQDVAHTENTAQATQVYTWFDTPLPTSIDSQLETLVSTQNPTSLLNKLALVLEKTYQPAQILLLCNLAACIHAKGATKRKPVFVHVFGSLAYRYLQLVLEYLKGELHAKKTYELSLERLIQDLARLATTRLSFESLNTLIDLAPDIIGKNELFDQWSRLYDFWMFYAHHVAVEGVIDAYSSDPSIKIVFERLQQLQMHAKLVLDSLGSLESNHPLHTLICTRLQHELQGFIDFEWRNGVIESIKVSDKDVQLINTVPEKKVQDFLVQVHNEQLTISTQATEASAHAVLESIGLSSLKSLVSTATQALHTDHIDARNLTETLETVHTTPSLVLITQNKLMTKIQDTLTSSWNPGEYLLYGETGGITKLKSKLAMNYTSSVFVRFKDWVHFANSESLKPFEKVVVVGLPFVPVSKKQLHAWGDKWAATLTQMRMFLVESVAGQVQQLGEKSVEYWNA